MPLARRARVELRCPGAVRLQRARLLSGMALRALGRRKGRPWPRVRIAGGRGGWGWGGRGGRVRLVAVGAVQETVGEAELRLGVPQRHRALLRAARAAAGHARPLGAARRKKQRHKRRAHTVRAEAGARGASRGRG